MTGLRHAICIAIALASAIRCGSVVYAAPAADLNQYRGNADCLLCHSLDGRMAQQRGVSDLVTLEEAKIWQNKDRHFAANRNLKSALGLSIGKLLNADVLNPSTGCVQCHSTSLDLVRTQGNVVDPIKEGVGCEACHGPSSRWVEAHRDKKWRNDPIASKTELGWTDVRSPVARAETCLSCHVGSAALNRVITHAMYAAGHPPLTGFEIESFAEKMPRHWRYSYEKGHPNHDSFERTRDILVASVVAVRTAMELAMADAKDDQRWPEFARMDCFACHHDVEGIDGRDWRKLDDTAGALGRPRLLAGCLPLVAAAVEMIQGPGAGKHSNDLERQLQALFATNSFGEPSEFATRGPKIVAGCRRVESRLEALEIQRKQAREVLHAIAMQAANESHDFDTARQLFGAWSVVYEELLANKALPTSAEVQNHVESGRRLFRLDKRQAADANAKVPDPLTVTEELPGLFGIRAKYSPANFSHAMSVLDGMTAEPASKPNQ